MNASDAEYWSKRFRSLADAIERARMTVNAAEAMSARILFEFEQWMTTTVPSHELMFQRIDELLRQGRPRSVFAKTLVVEFGISRSYAYELLKQYRLRGAQPFNH